MEFILNLNTEIHNPFSSSPVENAVSILIRDMKKTLSAEDGIRNRIVLKENRQISEEEFEIETSENEMILAAGSTLGFVYGLLFISEQYLGVKPFWFWLDQNIPFLSTVPVPSGTYRSKAPIIKYRGWFLNDEVLIMHWDGCQYKEYPWEMAFEAILRCGGNMVIPGTDKTSREYKDLASETGLIITHHHAEPLGAEMFSRAYPDLTPSWAEHPDEFLKVWEDAILDQKDQKVIWALGFRGQGDCPFWDIKGQENFDSSEKRGQLISELIELQRQMVCKHVENPVFCTNLYGEVMELYNEGYITLHPDIIKIWADNGYGKMVTRRRGNHCVRIPSLPKDDDNGRHGVYYHISFHDLQAASHMTTLPNSISFVDSELHHVMSLGVNDYWIINSSNIRPHAYYLDAVRKLWFGQSVSDETHSHQFADDYYSGNINVGTCLKDYSSSLLQYGEEEDQRAGEQFYNYSVRHLVRQFMIDRSQTVEELLWLTGNCSLYEQAEKILKICKDGEAKISHYFKQCQSTSDSLTGDLKLRFDTTVLLQAKIHYYCCKGAIHFFEGIGEFQKKNYQKSFYLLGCGAESFTTANTAMRNCEYGIWREFYENDCLTDIKFTSYVIKSAMRVIRVIGDDSRFAQWYEDFVRPEADRKVRLLAITQNHMTDDELFEAMKPYM